MKRKSVSEDISGPIIGIGVTLVAVSVVGYIGYNYIAGGADNTLNKITDATTGIYNDLKNAFGPVADTGKDILTVGGDVIQAGGGVLKEGLTILGDVTKTVGGLVRDGVQIADVGIRIGAETVKDIAVGGKEVIQDTGHELMKKDSKFVVRDGKAPTIEGDDGFGTFVLESLSNVYGLNTSHGPPIRTLDPKIPKPKPKPK